MQPWSKIANEQVNTFLERDPDFQKTFRELNATEPVFLSVLERLDEADRQTIDRYIALIEELEHIRTVTAFKCGQLLR